MVTYKLLIVKFRTYLNNLLLGTLLITILPNSSLFTLSLLVLSLPKNRRVKNLEISERIKETHPELNLFPKAVDYLTRFDHQETDGVTCWRSDSVERRSGS